MGTIKTYTAYHATDKSRVASIIKNNFTYRKSETHWLGNGTYFFLDKLLAFWWGKDCPTTKYGSIENPAYIEAVISVDDDLLCDMRELESYNNVKLAFDKFWQLTNSSRCIAKYDDDFFDRLECAFFNWLTQQWGLECIICCFQKRKLPIIDSKESINFNGMRLEYVEVQMCIKRASCISEIKEIS